MRKASLALCLPLASASLVFACLALSTQSTIAGTVSATTDLKTEIITAGHDAGALKTVVIAEKQIIAEGAQLVPQSVSLALRAERLDGQILKASSAIISDAEQARLRELVSAHLLSNLNQRLSDAVAKQREAGRLVPELFKFFSNPSLPPIATVLSDLSRATVPLANRLAQFDLCNQRTGSCRA